MQATGIQFKIKNVKKYLQLPIQVPTVLVLVIACAGTISIAGETKIYTNTLKSSLEAFFKVCHRVNASCLGSKYMFIFIKYYTKVFNVNITHYAHVSDCSMVCQFHSQRNSQLHSFFLFTCSFIHMCIHCLGHFSTLLRSAALPPSPLQLQAGLVLPLSLILLKRRHKHNKKDKAVLLVELRIAIQRDS
jgi:hypothetical protein